MSMASVKSEKKSCFCVKQQQRLAIRSNLLKTIEYHPFLSCSYSNFVNWTLGLSSGSMSTSTAF
jgi:short subunit fatty acids transporter